MTLKRITGVVFIILAILLTLAIVAQLPLLLTVIIRFLAIFRGNLDSSQIGESIGQMIYWILHFTATIILWRYGIGCFRSRCLE
jgi:hypothetical protein